MLGNNFDFTPSASDDPPGASFEIDSFGGRHPVTKQAKLKETRRRTPDSHVYFDDTFIEKPAFRLRRLREGPGTFARGVPTDGKTSAENYDPDKIKIIDGEHKTLLSLGRITEAFDDDDHSSHMLKHRLLLASGDLSETQRNALLEHIASHQKMYGKKLKAVQAAQKEATKQRDDILKNTGYRDGFGRLSRALPAVTDDVIPQDAHVDTERKRTAGNISMETRMRRFQNALRASGRGLRRRYL